MRLEFRAELLGKLGSGPPARVSRQNLLLEIAELCGKLGDEADQAAW